MRLQDVDSKSCVSVSLSLAFLHAIVKLKKKCGGTKGGINLQKKSHPEQVT